MKKLGLIILLSALLTSFTNAQDYKTGIGLRGGYANGITVKHFISPNAALEGILTSRWKGVQITGLYEIHNRAFNTDRLNWYYGFGGHVGFWDGDNTKKYWGDPGKTYTVVGIDGILGLEYNFAEIPINLSIDWKPSYNLVGHTGYWGDGGAISVRYIF
ncbi:hypothetical protein [Alkalitalea saponilacus]|uniref:Outer membrane insertion C-terminal signal n=1 Tax=Alkalitalea saponilacus TaxID=889453 RepID=A0A1T5G8Z2_9BACT|nr:hypothetical protein [Alkalitalea saponilacus]ASB47893.1 hypothetical protein CDL62_01370 [Alkalitalea saponilacus]SKC04842.1 hypothetical protein SAMN03080601_01774 [Alkalitalea saponilacus]